MEERELRFEAEVSEITTVEDDWSGDHVYSIVNGESDVAEMVGDDPDPMFVNLRVLTEGEATGKPEKKWYTKKAIQETASLLVGKLGYQGHQSPEKRCSEYRVPHMRIIKSRSTQVGGKEVCQAKAYVSKASRTFRMHLREKMAGPVSIDGRATFKYNSAKSRLEVVGMKEIRSVDFCNPGTSGSADAGVESIVQETRIDDVVETQEIPMDEKKLQAEHGDLVDGIVEKRTKVLSEKFHNDVAEMTEAHAAALAEVNGKNAELTAKLNGIELRSHADSLLDSFEFNEQVQEMISKRLNLETKIDEDISVAKARVSGEIQDAIKDVQEIASMTGGSLKKTEDAENGKTKTDDVSEMRTATPPTGGNPPRQESTSEADIRQKRLNAVMGKKG